MNIGFIGAGKVGCSFSKYLSINGAAISGFYSRSFEDAQEAADFVEGSSAYDSIASLVRSSDAVFITVPDGVIREVWLEIVGLVEARELDIAGKMFLHCSGACSSDLMKEADSLGAYRASLHPLFAVSSKFDTYSELSKAYFSIEGCVECQNVFVPLLERAGNTIQVVAADAKVRYHAAAVMASNQVIALYRVASNQLVRCGFTPDAAECALRPLFIGNAQHIVEDGTVAALTGPAERGDSETIAAHLSCLEGEDAEIYRLLTNVLYDIATEKHASSES